MELELRWTPNRGQDKFIADDVHTHVHGAAMRCSAPVDTLSFGRAEIATVNLLS